jgi:predicted nuclease of predicted toxin-antitoxin system
LKLLLDEMWPPSVAIQLRARGHDVVAVAERGDLRGRADPEIFAAAQLEVRAVVTEDRGGFRPLARAALQSGGSHEGLILTSTRAFPRRHEATFHRLGAALDTLLRLDVALQNAEHWLERLA